MKQFFSYAVKYSEKNAMKLKTNEVSKKTIVTTRQQQKKQQTKKRAVANAPTI